MFQNIFSDRSFNKKLLSLILPIAFQQFMLALVSASDAVMLGMITQDAMAAVSLATQITFVENLFLAAMTIGLSTFAAQYWGNRDYQRMEQIFAYVLKITVIVSCLFFLAALLLPEQLMGLLTNESILISGGAEYLRLVSPSYLLAGISQIYLCMLKNSSRAKAASIISSCGVVGDMILNAIFILGLLGMPRMEIAGAALSTTLARLVEVIWCFLLFSGQSPIKLRLAHLLHPQKNLRVSFWKYTFPVLGNEIVWGVGFTMYSVIMGHLGKDAVAANSIANIAKNLVACFCLGLANGGGIIIGNELGAGHLDTAKIYGRRLCILALLCGAASGLLLLAVTPFLLAFAGLTEQATHYLTWMLLICSYYMIGKSINSTTIVGIFCAGGDSGFGFLCDTVTMWCITVPLGFVAAFLLQLPVPVVYFIVSLDEFCKIPAVYRHYKKYLWVRNLTTAKETS